MRDLKKLYAAQKKWYENVVKLRRQNWLLENGPCKNCGSEQNLEIDHIDPKHKISHRLWTWKEERRLEELSKCDVLCQDCHKKRHANEAAQNRVHGTLQATRTTKYIKGCHCEKCRSAVAEYKTKWRQRTGRH